MAAHTYCLDVTWRPLLKDLGLSSADVLRRAGLPDDLLTRPAVRLASPDFYRFWEGMQTESGDPYFPLTLCQTIRGDSFSSPLFAALCSPNLLVAARRISRYKTIVAPMELEVREERDTLTLEFRWLEIDPTPPLSLVITDLLYFVSLARLGTREHIVPLHVRTTDLPTPRAAYDAFLGVRMQRGSGHQLVFRRADAVRPFLTSNEGVWAAFEPELRLRLAELDPTARTDQRVRAALLEALPSGLVSMDAVASKLAMSRRTLQRRLAAEETSFIDLVRETRESLARHYLENTGLPVSEIAFLLGFSEPRSFYRAFRAWTGRSPDHLRRERSGAPQAPRAGAP